MPATAEHAQSAVSEGESGTGLVVYRASRLEALIPPLWSLLDVSWSDNVLESQTIVAAHPSMKQWLTGALARHTGTSGIAANLDVVLPSVWLDRLATATLGERAVSLPRYQRTHLCWALHEMLAPGRPVAGVSDPRIAAYLAIDGNGDPARSGALARRRYQLADRLARIYSQYLVYRPDWLKAWERGHFRSASGAAASASLSMLEEGLLGPLWKKLSSDLGRHRGQAVEELRAFLTSDITPRPTLHVFGTSHLAPAEIDIVRAYAVRGLVALYVPDPCREYWGGLVKWDCMRDGGSDAWSTYRTDEAARIQAAGEGDYWQEQDHALLARWGRMGQHFLSMLTDGDVREDTRHWQDEQPKAPINRLQRLQEGIRQLNPRLMQVDASNAATEAHEVLDTSLRIHSCHTRLRELEVLRDALLDAMAAGIQPGEMIVMTPDIQAYMSLIPAIFGAAGDPYACLPYRLADTPVSSSHGLCTTFLRLLELPGQRITAPEVVDLLSVPEIRRRLGIDEDDVDDLTEWMRQSRVAWALDGAHRARFGVPPISEHTFAWAMDRMIAGYLMSDAPEADRDRAFNLPDHTVLAPVTGIHGPSAEALGALDRLLQQLQALLDLSSETRAASAWAQQLDQQLDALFTIDPRDKEAREAWDTLKRFVRAIETEPKGAHVDPVLHFSVVHDLLVDALGSVPERQRFLMGGVTFCRMVVQRAIPFRMVAVLGLNDGDFPRNASDAGLDLMTHIRRMGDRDVRVDDRYLFLETTMSVRDRLHLSFIGQGVKDGKPRNPAAPLAELMAELDRAGGRDNDADAEKRPWLVKHPLQPFDPRYFNGKDKRLFSYDTRFQAMQGSGRNRPRPFLQEGSDDPDSMPNPLALSEVANYYKDPAQNVLEKRLKLRLDALDQDRLREEEPLEGTLDRIATVARKVFFKDVLPTWPEGVWQPDAIPSWVRLTGLLPPGRPGEKAWQKELEAINTLMDAARACAVLNRDVATQARQESVDVGITDACCDPPRRYRITGRIQHVFPITADGVMGLQLVRAYSTVSGSKGGLKSEDDLHFGERVSIFLDWALLRLQTIRRDGPLAPVRITLLVKDEETPWQAGLAQWDEELVRSGVAAQNSMLDELRSRVARLVHWWHEAQRLPHWYFARTSWKAAKLLEKSDLEPADFRAVQKEWSDFDGRGERTHGSGYNRLLGGDIQFDAQSIEFDALLEFSRGLRDAISFSPPEKEVHP